MNVQLTPLWTAGQRCWLAILGFNRTQLGEPKGALLLLLLPLLLGGCGQLDFAWGALLSDVQVAPAFITPNADGDQDVTDIAYRLRRTAQVSIYFDNAQGERFYFRRDRRRSPGDYHIQWGGVMDEAHTIETSSGPQEILSQVLPDGVYQWTVAAVDDQGRSETATGSITLQEGDTEIPQLNNFAVVPEIFRPNQDSFADWVSISYYLTKDVNTLLLYLVDPRKPAVKYYIGLEPGLSAPTEHGYKDHRYEADMDKNAEPPPDGVYAIVAEARDRAGNAVRVTRSLTIQEGGKPRADVDQGEINWYSLVGGQQHLELNRTISLALGDKLCFEAFVVNEGVTPIRTAGPWPDQEYKFTENRNTLATHYKETHDGDRAWFNQSGAWRFGINYESAGSDFPFRWAIGRMQDLERRVINGHEQWYLLPGKRAKVAGCILFDVAPPLASNIWWGGLIHEDVAVANNNIDRITVIVEAPAEQEKTAAPAEQEKTAAPAEQEKTAAPAATEPSQ